MGRAIKVNADYESQLFYGRPGPQILNHSLEFFSFFLEPRALHTTKAYPEAFLEYVEVVTGRRPQTVQGGPTTNWWGDLKDRKLEAWLNSKVTSSELNAEKKFCERTRVFRNFDDFYSCSFQYPLILKNPYGMSGQKFQVARSSDELQVLNSWIAKSFEEGPLVVEPFFERKWDFSHFIFPDGKKVAYENFINEKFQYRGSLFRNHFSSSVEDLSFYKSVSLDEWKKFHASLDTIARYFHRSEYEKGFSVDSFVYEESTILKVRALCEVNHRRTMGRVAYDLAQRYAPDQAWVAMILGKSFKEYGGFPVLKQRLAPLLSREVIILSPGDVRFEAFLLKACVPTEGVALYEQVRTLLPECELSIKI